MLKSWFIPSVLLVLNPWAIASLFLSIAPFLVTSPFAGLGRLRRASSPRGEGVDKLWILMMESRTLELTHLLRLVSLASLVAFVLLAALRDLARGGIQSAL